MSRGPVREALGRLAAEGLVTVRPRRGAVVRSLSKDEFLEAYQVREALEMMAVRLAVPTARAAEDMRRARGADRDDGRACGARRGRRVLRGQRRVSRSLVEPSGNAKLRELYRQLLGQIGRYRLRSLEPPRQPATARSPSTRRSCAPRSAGDAERAAHLVSEHIRVPQRRPRRSLSDEDPTLSFRLVRMVQAHELSFDVRRQPEQPRAADRAGLRPADAARPVRGGRGRPASTRSGSATASSRSRATSRSRSSRRSRSARRA